MSFCKDSEFKSISYISDTIHILYVVSCVLSLQWYHEYVPGREIGERESYSVYLHILKDITISKAISI